MYVCACVCVWVGGGGRGERVCVFLCGEGSVRWCGGGESVCVCVGGGECEVV